MGFSYEQPRNDFISFDYDIGVIGLQLGDYFDKDVFYGGYAAFGPRMYFKKDTGPMNNLRGLYFKPQLLLNYFGYRDSVYYYDYLTGESFSDEITGTDLSISLLACLGTQWILSDLIVFDLWFGLGYGGGWESVDNTILPDPYVVDPDNPFKYSFVHMGYSPLIFDGGLSIGFVW